MNPPRPRPAPRTWAWLVFLALTAGLCLMWTLLPPPPAASQIRVSLFALLGLSGLGLVLLFPDISPRRTVPVILIAAVLLRLLLLPAPVSDDVYRYLWEGRLVLAGENPYAATADAPLRVTTRDADWAKMNHRDRLTAYPPGIQWIFAATVSLTSNPLGMKLPALAGDLASLGLLLALLKRRHLPLRWAGFYAFNPVILISYAAEAHFDSLMTAALLAALLAAACQQSVRAWFWLGAAIQIKIVCLCLLPLFLTRRLRRSAWVLLPVLVFPTLPFASHLPNLFAGVKGFTTSGQFNAPLVSLFDTILPLTLATRLAALCFLVSAALILRTYLRRQLDLPTATGFILTALVCCSPIVHFWYLAWLIPFAALRPSFATAILSLTMAGYFIASWSAAQGHGWGYGPAITAAIWLPAALAWLLQNRHLLTFRKAPTQPATAAPNPAPTLGIIIPTLNPGPALATLLQQLRHETGPDLPIIIADATLPPSLPSPQASLVCSARGRGLQIATGINALPPACDWILIAHSDTTPRPGWLTHLQSAIASHPDVSLFVFGQRFTPSRPSTLLIEVLNELRILFGGVAFGDQTMVIHRARLTAAGGFPAQPLMEDVEASLRLRPHGRVHYLAHEWQVSAQKWHGPLLPRIAFIIRLLLTYYRSRLQGPAAAAQTAKRLYTEYYPNPTSLKTDPLLTSD